MSIVTELQDRLLARQFLQGQAAAVAKVRRWIRGAFSPYRARLGTDLEDLEQEVLVDLLHSLRREKFKRECRLQTYVRTYVHHKCIDRLRADRRREWVDIDSLALASEAPSPYEALNQAQRASLALKIIEGMPPSCRQLWDWLAEGLRYQEMSRRLAVSEGTLRVRVLRCRRRALELRALVLARSNENTLASTKGEKASNGE